jgi:hypothetical protein
MNKYSLTIIYFNQLGAKIIQYSKYQKGKKQLFFVYRFFSNEMTVETRCIASLHKFIPCTILLYLP